VLTFLCCNMLVTAVMKPQRAGELTATLQLLDGNGRSQPGLAGAKLQSQLPSVAKLRLSASGAKAVTKFVSPLAKALVKQGAGSEAATPSGATPLRQAQGGQQPGSAAPKAAKGLDFGGDSPAVAMAAAAKPFKVPLGGGVGSRKEDWLEKRAAVAAGYR